MWEDSEINDCRLSEGSETDGEIDDEEDIEINGRSTCEDSVQYLRFVNMKYFLFF